MTSVKLMKWLMVSAVLLAAGGCGNEVNRSVGAEARVEQDALRVRADAKRGRLWVLGLDDLRVYDSAGKRLIRKVELPGWSVARFICDPDLALDASGSAIVSSNAQPRLWRVDGNSFAVSEQVMVLQEREHWDIGFGALAFAPDGTLYAMTSIANSLWKVDAAGADASLVESYHAPLKTCALTAQILGRLERAPRS